MSIKIKHSDPTLNEFSPKEIIINVSSDKLFFRGDNNLVEVGAGSSGAGSSGGGQWTKKDNNNIFYRSGSAQVLDDGTNNYIIELEAASSGPRINFGDNDSSNDSFMILGAFSGINNLNTKGRDFHLFGTNTTTGFYFDESAGKFGIGTTKPSGSLHINESTGTSQGASGQGSLVLSHDNTGGVSSIVFVSKVNSTSDRAYIQYEEDASDFGTTTENGLLTIGVENDSSSTNEDAIKFRLNASDRMVMRGDGKIGIGTNDPDELFQVEGSVDNDDIAIKIQNTSDDNSASTPPRAALLLDAASNNAYFRCFGAPDDAASGHQIDIGSSAGSSFLTFTPSNSEAMRLTSGGNLGINTTTPDENLEVNGSIYINAENHGIIVDAADYKRFGVMKYTGHEAYFARVAGQDFGIVRTGGSDIHDGSSLTTDLYIAGDGDVGINTVNPQEKLDVNGTVKCTGFQNTSDIKLKTNINNIKTPLETIQKLKGVTFNWKNNIIETDKSLQGIKHGFIAQEVEKILPSLVTDSKNKSVSYLEIIPILVEAIKEQQNQINELKNKLNE